MDTVQLTFILRKDRCTRGVCQGVYPSDKLPTSISSLLALFVSNLNTSDETGSRWVALYFTKNREGEFFDSYALHPSSYTGGFSSFFFNNISSNWTFNSVALQSINSSVCDHYCL